MIGYTALRWPVNDKLAGAMADRVCGSLKHAGWQLAIDLPGWRILHQPSVGVEIVRRASGHRILIGHAFDSTATASGTVIQATVPTAQRFEDACRAFVQSAWGAYVLLETGSAEQSSVAVFRDPVGRLDCLHWTWRSLTIVTSRAEALLALAPPEGLAIDWAQVRTLLRSPGSACEILPLRGVNQIEAGTLGRAGASPVSATRLWSPAEVAQRSASVNSALPHALPALVEACTAAWASVSKRAVTELSGGLDSSIVATALVRTAAVPIVGWFNYHAPDREGDERAYAAAVAIHLGIDLTTVPTRRPQLDEKLFNSLPVAARPNVAGVGLFHDADLAERACALGADALFTGHGGDALFFQFPTASLATEVVRSRHRVAKRVALLDSLAQWTGSTIWSLLRTASREALRGAPDLLPELPIDLVARGMTVEPPPRHWLCGTETLSASKRLQILSLSSARSIFSGGWSAAAMTTVHPLLSQPLIDYVLPLSPLDLTQARRDRALIRQAYTGRLPEVLLLRRGKGSTTQLFGRALAASTLFLRAYLLDGILAAHGCLDLNLLDILLDPDRLMLEDSYGEILALLLMERWSRVWADRIAVAGTAASGLERRQGNPI